MECDRSFVSIEGLKEMMKRLVVKGTPANTSGRKEWAVADKGSP